MTVTEAFQTKAGIRIPAVSAFEMSEIDRLAIEEFGPNLFQMMENAGRSLASSVIDRIGTEPREVTVLAGLGSNGGGGICAARHLANRGLPVTVVTADEHELGEVPRQQLAVYRSTDGALVRPDQVRSLAGNFIIDALVGYRLTGPIRGFAADVFEAVDLTGAFVIALDVPSGVDASTGKPTGRHLTADATVTLALPKTGLNHPLCGQLELADIGIPRNVYRQIGVDIPPATFLTADRVGITPIENQDGS